MVGYDFGIYAQNDSDLQGYGFGIDSKSGFELKGYGFGSNVTKVFCRNYPILNTLQSTKNYTGFSNMKRDFVRNSYTPIKKVNLKHSHNYEDDHR